MESRNIRLEGIVTALSPIVHMSGESHDDKNGGVIDENIKWLVAQDRNFEDVAIINGSSYRGRIRRSISLLIAEQIKSFKHLNDFRLRFCGGTPSTQRREDKKGKKKGAGTVMVDLEKERRFRENSPFLSLIGGQGKAPIPGHLRVSALVPFCNATKHILPDYFTEDKIDFLEKPPLSKHIFTRHDETNNPIYDRYLSSTAKAERDAEFEKTLSKKELKAKTDSEADALSDEEKYLRAEKGYNVQMIRKFEAIPAGISMYSWIEIFNASDEEIGLLVAGLKKFSAAPYIGGRSASGYGRIGAAYSLTIDGDYDNREENALLFNLNEGFVLNSQFLQDCMDKAYAWIRTLTPENVSLFGEE